MPNISVTRLGFERYAVRERGHMIATTTDHATALRIARALAGDEAQPDLLAALKAVNDWYFLKGMGDDCEPMRLVREAIAKAEGR